MMLIKYRFDLIVRVFLSFSLSLSLSLSVSPFLSFFLDAIFASNYK